MRVDTWQRECSQFMYLCELSQTLVRPKHKRQRNWLVNAWGSTRWGLDMRCNQAKGIMGQWKWVQEGWDHLILQQPVHLVRKAILCALRYSTHWVFRKWITAKPDLFNHFEHSLLLELWHMRQDLASVVFWWNAEKQNIFDDQPNHFKRAKS